MKEALKLCVAELREARGEVEEVMHNYAAALAGTEMGNRYVAQYRRQLARIDAAIAAAEAALALPEPEPVAWMHVDGRVVPAATMATARKDGGATLSSLRGYTIPLYAGSAPTQSASPFAPCGRSAGTCGISSQTCGRDGCEADVVPADQLPKSQELLAWSSLVVAGMAQMAAVTAERDQLRAEVERLHIQRVPLTDAAALAVIDGMGWDLDSIELIEMMGLVRAVEASHGIRS